MGLILMRYRMGNSNNSNNSNLLLIIGGLVLEHIIVVIMVISIIEFLKCVYVDFGKFCVV